jgi:HSP20 family molecular chaperone IbpA
LRREQKEPAMQQSNDVVRAPVRLFHTDETVTIAAQMPGLSDDDITVTAGDDRRVTLEGRLCSAPDHAGCGALKGVKDVVLDEWRPGPYRRDIELPLPVDASRGHVTYGNGVVVVALPVASAMTPARLTVGAGRR